MFISSSEEMEDYTDAYSMLLAEITDKQDWYSKVFDVDIVQKWKEECPNKEVFWCVIRILRLTAKGCNYNSSCEWKEGNCDLCRTFFMSEGKNNYRDYGCNSFDEFMLDVDELIYEASENCEHTRCQCTGPHRKLEDYLEYKKTVRPDTHQQLKLLIARLEEETVDMHPELSQEGTSTSSVVRDLVHPSLYCYVEPLKDEQEKYQWLPAEVDIANGNVRFVSPINNLNQDVYSYSCLEECFSQFLPSLFSVLGTVSTQLQVIVKIGSIELDEQNPIYPGGSWHIEGMPYEHIAATCLHYIETEGITDSFLEFRKPVYLNEDTLAYPQNDEAYTWHHYGIKRGSHHDGRMRLNLGLIKAQEGYSVVFPNFLQHRVKEFRLAQGISKAKRTIIAFFVIDPEERIVSTADGPFPLVTREEAEDNRIRLMLQRKYFVDDLNKIVYEREYSLCEH